MPDDEAGKITAEARARVARYMKSQEGPDRDEAFHVLKSGIPQSTYNAAARGAKLGHATAQRLARYFGWGDDVAGFLSGTEPAGHYTSLEGRMAMGYPKRGFVLDRFRGIVPSEVLDEVQRIVLPPGSPDWTEFQWAKEVIDTANRWERLGKLPPPTNGGSGPVGGQGPGGANR